MDTEQTVAEYELLGDEQLATAIEDLEAGETDFDDTVEQLRDGLLVEIAEERVSVRALRLHVRRANRLDREATEAADFDIDRLAGDEWRSAMTHRLAHHAGRAALEQVKTYDREIMARADHRRRAQQLAM